jgi:hypothetical protein
LSLRDTRRNQLYKFKINLPLTTQQITFLSDIPSNIKVDKTSGWRYHQLIGLEIYAIESWLRLIGDDKIYLLIPFLSGSQSLSKPRLRISNPFLVTNKSNPVLILNFIQEQWNSSGFNLNNATTIYLNFEFKRVYLSLK